MSEKLPHNWCGRVTEAVFDTLKVGAPGLSDQTRNVLALSVARKLCEPKPRTPLTEDDRRAFDEILAATIRSPRGQP